MTNRLRGPLYDLPLFEASSCSIFPSFVRYLLLYVFFSSSS